MMREVEETPLSFEAWHFRRSAVMHHAFASALVATLVVDALRTSDEVMAQSNLVMAGLAAAIIAARAAAHIWVEPTLAQKLLSRFSFVIFCLMYPLYAVYATTMTAEDAQKDIALEFVVAPVLFVLSSTFAYARWQYLIFLLLSIVYDASLFYTASEHGSQPVVAWASNGVFIMALGATYATSVAVVVFHIDAQNRATHRMLVPFTRPRDSESHPAMTTTTGYVKLDIASGTASTTDQLDVADPSSVVAAPGAAGEEDATLPFEAWQFRRAAMLHHMLCGVFAVTAIIGARSSLEPAMAKSDAANLAMAGLAAGLSLIHI